MQKKIKLVSKFYFKNVKKNYKQFWVAGNLTGKYINELWTFQMFYISDHVKNL